MANGTILGVLGVPFTIVQCASAERNNSDEWNKIRRCEK